MSLLEVVLALGILAIGIGSVLTMLSFGAALANQAERRAGAAAALGAVLPNVEATLFPLLEDGSVGPADVFAERPVPGHRGYTHSVAALPIEGSGPIELWRVDIAIEWRGRGARQAVEFTTVMPRSVPLGERLRRNLFGAPPPPAAPVPSPDPTATATSNDVR